MGKASGILRDILITAAILCACFISCLIVQNIFKDDSLIPALFVLGVFLTSVITERYTYGIAAALISVLAVNYAFTFPFFRLNFTMPENLVSAIIMIIISMITCVLTTKIKNQKEIRDESERERMRANLLRAVSHDLRTPLTTIYGSSSALLENWEDFSPEQKKKMLLGIRQDSEWISRMVENLLSITRVGNDNVKIIKTPTVLDELIDAVLVKLNKRYPNQEVMVDIPEDFVVIPMDAMLIEQVLINILDNAVRHAEGMTELSLRVFLVSDKVIFEIRDNGRGIPEDRRKGLFTGDYISEKSPSDRNKNSSGIGLSVCATIIKAHGGYIKAENPKSGGAIFKFSLDMEEHKNE